MSEGTALAVASPQTAAAWNGKLNQAELDLFNRACHGATPEEANLLFQTARSMGLNPVIGGYIHGVKRWDSRSRREIMQIQVGIGGYRLCALRTGQYEGRLGPQFCGEDGLWRDSWPFEDPPSACRVGIRRRGFLEPLWHVTHYREAVQTDREGKPNRTWAKMPATMLAKATEAAALRAAFPDLLSGTYSPEELGEAETSAVGVRTALTTEEGDYLPEATPDLVAARKKLIGLFSAAERATAWVQETAGVELERLPLPDVQRLIARVEAARAAKAGKPQDQQPQQPQAPQQPKKTAPDWNTLNRQLQARRSELFGDGAHGLDFFYRWCDRANLLEFDTQKQRPSIAGSTAEQLQECLQAMAALTEEAVADFARECQEADAAQDAELSQATPGAPDAGKEPWDE